MHVPYFSFVAASAAQIKYVILAGARDKVTFLQCRGIWRKGSLIFFETDLFDLQILACFACNVSSSVWKGKSCSWSKADVKTSTSTVGLNTLSSTLSCFDCVLPLLHRLMLWVRQLVVGPG